MGLSDDARAVLLSGSRLEEVELVATPERWAGDWGESVLSVGGVDLVGDVEGVVGEGFLVDENEDGSLGVGAGEESDVRIVMPEDGVQLELT